MPGGPFGLVTVNRPRQQALDTTSWMSGVQYGELNQLLEMQWQTTKPQKWKDKFTHEFEGYARHLRALFDGGYLPADKYNSIAGYVHGVMNAIAQDDWSEVSRNFHWIGSWLR